jgi:predicted alpha/beta superfamily hydrolase
METFARCTALRVAAVALLLAAPRAHAQAPVALPGTVQREVVATSNGVTYRLDIALPPGHDTTTRRYPVFLILDGNLAFPLASETQHALALAGAPPMILVGIGYPGTAPEVFTPAYSASRARDYTPTLPKGAPTGSAGGASAFLAFIKDELLPLIGRDYRADLADVGLGGHSLGGLFTTYALLHAPATFSKYWIGSPSLWWDDKVSFSYLDAPALKSAPPRGRAYLTVGSDETSVMVPPMHRMAKELATRFPSLRVGSQRFPEETHVSVVGASVSRAFRYLYTTYGQPFVTLPARELAAYAGRWSDGKGKTVTITVERGELLVEQMQGQFMVKSPVVASDRDHLFERGSAGEMVAERDATGKVVRLKSTIANLATTFERVK